MSRRDPADRPGHPVEEEQVLVLIIAIGTKDGNRLIIDGEEVDI